MLEIRLCIGRLNTSLSRCPCPDGYTLSDDNATCIKENGPANQMVNKGQGGCGGAPYLYEDAAPNSIDDCADKCLADEMTYKWRIVCRIYNFKIGNRILGYLYTAKNLDPVFRAYDQDGYAAAFKWLENNDRSYHELFNFDENDNVNLKIILE